MTTNKRHASQTAFVESGQNLQVGNINHCPIPPEALAATTRLSPYVIDVFDSGLTAEVYRVRFDGQDYTLKKKRPVALVKNLDGEFSFLNEVQRRCDFHQKKCAPHAPNGLDRIVNTVYADFKLGILLSEWIEGEPIKQLTPDIISQLFSTLLDCEKLGLFEWDLCPGNLLIDKNQQVRLFDFGYMYPFDPKTELNSNGLRDPLFHMCERFETRFLSGWLLQNHIDKATSKQIFRWVKEEAVAILSKKQRWLAAQQAQPSVIEFIQAMIANYQHALIDKARFNQLYRVEMFRSHVLDIEDDLEGKSCTPITLERVDYVLATLNKHYELLRKKGALFYQNEGKTRSALINIYQQKRELVLQYQI